MKVENMTSTKTGKQIANQFVIDAGKERYFQSYKTIIAYYNVCTSIITIDNGESYQPEKNNGADEFSRTTMKYLLQFIREFTPYNVTNSRQINLLLEDGLFKSANLNA